MKALLPSGFWTDRYAMSQRDRKAAIASAMAERLRLRPGVLRSSAPTSWIDHLGNTWPTPTSRGRLKFRIRSHAALRDFVFHRDENMCAVCGADGWLVLDHIISQKNGGSHHPDNAQTLCWNCNSAKVGIVDVPRKAA